MSGGATGRGAPSTSPAVAVAGPNHEDCWVTWPCPRCARGWADTGLDILQRPSRPAFSPRALSRPPAPQTEGEELKPSGGGQAGARRRARRCFQGRLDRAPGQQTSSSGERLPREAAARAGPGRVAPLWGSAGLAQRRQEGGQREGPRDCDGGRGRPPEGGWEGGRAGPEGTSNTSPASLTARSWGSFPSLGSCRGSWSGLLHCRGMVTRRRKHLG